MLEWFDFAVYGYFASNIGQQFFTQSSHTAQQLLTFAKGGAPIKSVLSLKRLVSESTRLALSGTNITFSLTGGDQGWSIDAD